MRRLSGICAFSPPGYALEAASPAEGGGGPPSVHRTRRRDAQRRGNARRETGARIRHCPSGGRYPGKSCGLLRERKRICQFIEHHRYEYPIGLLCHTLGIGVSGYFTWWRRLNHPFVLAHKPLSASIVATHEGSRSTCGAPTYWLLSRRRGTMSVGCGSPN